MPYILSTLTAGQDYTFYVKQDINEGINRVSKVITINGGANVADKHFLTKDGILTEISDDNLELLQTHPVFQTHLKNGFVKIMKSNSEKDVRKGKKDMSPKDNGAPLTPESFEKEGKKVPKAKGSN